MAEPRGHDIRIPAHYDPRATYWDPAYDPGHSDRGTITGRDVHQPPKER